MRTVEEDDDSGEMKINKAGTEEKSRQKSFFSNTLGDSKSRYDMVSKSNQVCVAEMKIATTPRDDSGKFFTKSLQFNIANDDGSLASR